MPQAPKKLGGLGPALNGSGGKQRPRHRLSSDQHSCSGTARRVSRPSAPMLSGLNGMSLGTGLRARSLTSAICCPASAARRHPRPSCRPTNLPTARWRKWPVLILGSVGGRAVAGLETAGKVWIRGSGYRAAILHLAEEATYRAKRRSLTRGVFPQVLPSWSRPQEASNSAYFPFLLAGNAPTNKKKKH